jgi:hypothetical protein
MAAAASWLDDLSSRQPTGTATWQRSTLHDGATVAIASTGDAYADAQMNGWNGNDLQWHHFDLDVRSGSTSAYAAVPVSTPLKRGRRGSSEPPPGAVRGLVRRTSEMLWLWRGSIGVRGCSSGQDAAKGSWNP